jgi:hypothetical protein
MSRDRQIALALRQCLASIERLLVAMDAANAAPFEPAKARIDKPEKESSMSHPLDRIARVCHEVNRAYCQALGDNSQAAWEEAPEWQRVSARMGVDLHLSGNFGPEASHIAWMRQKQEEGWVYGPVKDPELKQHPCMLPFDELPPEQQAKDFIFRAIVHALQQA